MLLQEETETKLSVLNCSSYVEVQYIRIYLSLIDSVLLQEETETKLSVLNCSSYVEVQYIRIYLSLIDSVFYRRKPKLNYQF